MTAPVPIFLFVCEKSLHKNKKWLLISHVNANHGLAQFLAISGVKQEIPEDHFFSNTDLAIEWAEDRLLEQFCPAESCRQFGLGDLDLFHGFFPDELDQIETLLTKNRFVKGELVIREGDTDRDLYILMRGSVSVKIRLPLSQGETRLFTFSAGVVF